MIETRKYLAERDAGRALYPGFASVPPDPRPVTSADSVNVGNISVLHHHGKLLALWEAGSPWDIDAKTLDTNGIVRFSDETSGLPFSAHPRVEPDGTLWNFGYVSNAHLLVLWHIDKSGALKNVGTIPCDPISMPHDFLVTEKHIVILIPPFNFEPVAGGVGFLDAHKWKPDQPTRVLVVDKNDFTTYQWTELPAQWIFHYGNAWEDGSGIIHFDGARAPHPILMINQFREIMRGVVTSEGTSSVHTRYRLDTVRNKASEVPMLGFNIDSEFPVIDPRVSCRRNEKLVMLTREHESSAPHPNLTAVSVYEDASQRLTSYTYPDHIIPEEHLFVPKPGSAPETEGWIVGTSLNFRDARTEINVFDVTAVDAGPVYRAATAYALPLGLHGRFVAA